MFVDVVIGDNVHFADFLVVMMMTMKPTTGMTMLRAVPMVGFV